MGSLPTESFSVQEQQQLNMDDTSRKEREQWLLNSPDPPSLWHEVVGSLRGTLSSSRTKQTCSRRAFSLLQGLFPILDWGRNYKASKFKSDLMAGLTLASLSIPQVKSVLFSSFCLFLEESDCKHIKSVSHVCRALDMLI